MGDPFVSTRKSHARAPASRSVYGAHSGDWRQRSGHTRALTRHIANDGATRKRISRLLETFERDYRLNNGIQGKAFRLKLRAFAIFYLARFRSFIFSWPSLLGEWNRYQSPTHHVSRLEIPLWAFGVHIVTIGAVLRHGFISIECLEDASPALGGNASIGTIGVHEDLRKPGPLELRRWTILFIDRPTADELESNPFSLLGRAPPRFLQKLGR